MSAIRDAFTLRNKVVEIDGISFTVRRPSVMDFLESMEVAKTKPEHLQAFLVYSLLVDDGKPVFGSVDEVLNSDVRLVQAIARECEKLYEEGRD